jgi:hypothetical protein
MKWEEGKVGSQGLQERPDAGLKYRIVRCCGQQNADAPHPVGEGGTREAVAGA